MKEFPYRLSVPTIKAIIEQPPAPFDDLTLGIRTLSELYWTRDDIPSDVRAGMRAWTRMALDILHPEIKQD